MCFMFNCEKILLITRAEPITRGLAKNGRTNKTHLRLQFSFTYGLIGRISNIHSSPSPVRSMLYFAPCHTAVL